MTRPIDTTKFPDLSSSALGFDPDALALAMWRYSNPYANPDPDVVLGRRQQSKAPARGRGQSKPRKPTLAAVAKQANKAAISVGRYEVKPDGTIVIVTGEPHADEVTPLEQWRKRRGQG
jgi:hypothetical protein